MEIDGALHVRSRRRLRCRLAGHEVYSASLALTVDWPRGHHQQWRTMPIEATDSWDGAADFRVHATS